jgi:hypothetical protein
MANEEKIREALNSDEIRPIFKEWDKSFETTNKVARYIFKPFLAGMAVATIYAGIAAYHNLRAAYEFNREPIVRELVQIRKEKGDEAARQVIESNKGLYQPILDSAYSKKNEGMEQLHTAFNIGTGVTFVTLGILGATTINTRRKRKRLEEALSQKRLSLEDLRK